MKKINWNLLLDITSSKLLNSVHHKQIKSTSLFCFKFSFCVFLPILNYLFFFYCLYIIIINIFPFLFCNFLWPCLAPSYEKERMRRAYKFKPLEKNSVHPFLALNIWKEDRPKSQWHLQTGVLVQGRLEAGIKSLRASFPLSKAYQCLFYLSLFFVIFAMQRYYKHL